MIAVEYINLKGVNKLEPEFSWEEETKTDGTLFLSEIEILSKYCSNCYRKYLSHYVSSF